jgi:uncharacterized protein (DUF1697 family)
VALVVLLKGVNVGGHRTFRPSRLATQLQRFDVVNVGAAGTFIVRKTVSRTRLRAAIARRLPFQADIMICDGREILRFVDDNPFGDERLAVDIVRFVSVLAKSRRASARLPLTLPPRGRWSLKVLECRRHFVFGLYRREMKAIGYLGQLEKAFGVSVTTRNWNTMLAIARILRPAGS